MTIRPRYVELAEGIPVLMKFSDHYIAEKEIMDQTSGRVKKVQTIQLVVTHLNGKPVDAEWSILSMKLIERIQPYIASGQIKTRVFKVTKHGKGFYTKYELEVL